MDSFETSSNWQHIGAWLGVFWAFWVLATIPGWFALSRYRKWKHGELGVPRFLVGWGWGFSALVIIGIIGNQLAPIHP